jgi:predicted dehydrogenase
MKLLFIGSGSIGQRHARLASAIPGMELMAFRSHGSRVVDFPGIQVFEWDEALRYKPDVAFITNPTSMHISSARRCAEAGCGLFLEKPIGSSNKGLDELLKIVAASKKATYVAYNLRFHPLIIKLKEYIEQGTFLHMSVLCSSYLPDWRPGTEVKKNYSSQAALGGGVVFDLSHEIDYTEYLLGPVQTIQGNYSRRSDITVDSEDWADMAVVCERGPALIHCNFFSRIQQRVIQIDFKEFSVAADLVRGEWSEFKDGAQVKTQKIECPRDFTYQKQLEYFFTHSNDQRMMNNIFDAARLFKKILEFKEHYAISER